MRCGAGFVLCHAAGDFTADVGDAALQIAHASLESVFANDLLQRRLAELDLARLQAVRLELARDQELAGDGQLLFLDVTGEFDHLEPVAQRGRHRVEDVGRRDEHHLAQVVRDLEIVVAERVVLLRIQYFQQRGRGVAAEIQP